MENEEEDRNVTEGWRKSMRRRVTGHVIRRFGWDMDLQTVAAALRNELPKHAEIDENTLFLVEVTVTRLPYDAVVDGTIRFSDDTVSSENDETGDVVESESARPWM